MVVLDASSLIAFFMAEKGGEQVKKVFLAAKKRKESVFIHQVNYVECLYKLRSLLGDDCEDVLVGVSTSTLLVVSSLLDDEMALFVASVKSVAKNVSLADSYGLAFAKRLGAVFYTADKLLLPIGKKFGVDVFDIRS